LQDNAKFAEWYIIYNNFVQQESAILKKHLQTARFNKNLQYSSRYLIAQELKVLAVCIYFDIFRIIHFVAIPQQTTCQEENPFQL
jgi:hypothetical protein